MARTMPHRQFPSSELCITHKFSNRSPSNPNGIPPQSPGLGGTTYPGNNVQEAFSTPKVLRQSSAIWAQPRWGCFEAGPRTQGRPAAVAEGQPWAGGRNPVGIKGNEAAPQIANLWVMHSSWEGQGWVLLRCQYRIPKSDLRPCVCEPLKASCRQAVSTHPRGSK